jgi:hypothetical protein
MRMLAGSILFLAAVMLFSTTCYLSRTDVPWYDSHSPLFAMIVASFAVAGLAFFMVITGLIREGPRNGRPPE